MSMLDSEMWGRSLDPAAMLSAIPPSRVTERKLRLFLVACLRDQCAVPALQQAVDAAELYAEGQVSGEWVEEWARTVRAIERDILADRKSGRETLTGLFMAGAVQTAFRPLFDLLDRDRDQSTAAGYGLDLLTRAASGETGILPDDPDESREKAAQIRARQAAFARSVWGDFFHPIEWKDAWRTDTAVSLTQRMYDARDFSEMPKLGEALSDAGCGRPNILTHCRSGGPYCRGDWVVDLVLGKG